MNQRFRPVHVLIGAIFTEALGVGLYVTVGVIYFTRIVGLTPPEVGLALTIAGLVGLISGVWLGALADRHDPRRILFVAIVGQALATLALLIAQTVVTYSIACVVAALTERAAYGARGAIMAAIISADQQVTVRAKIRASFNIALAVGSAGGALTLQIDQAWAYRVAILVNAATFLLSAFISARLPDARRSAGEDGPAALLPTVFRDRRYVAVSALNGVIMCYTSVLDVAVPIWLVTETTLPRWSVGAVMIANMAMVVALQVRLSRGNDDPLPAARNQRKAGLLFLLACVALGFADSPSVLVAAALVAVGTVVYSLGEMIQSGAAWGLSYALAPDGHHGQYQAMFGVWVNGGTMIGPLLCTAVIITNGRVGWLAVGAFLAVAGAAFPFLVRAVDAPETRGVR